MMSGDDAMEYVQTAEMLVGKLADVQASASRIQNQRKALVALDERRQKLREAEGMLRKSKVQGANTWVCLGSTTFLEFPTTTACKFLSQDRKVVEETIVETDKDLKRSVNELMKLEGNKNLADRGFDLKSIKE